jgi:hypothetical protein
VTEIPRVTPTEALSTESESRGLIDPEPKPQGIDSGGEGEEGRGAGWGFADAGAGWRPQWRLKPSVRWTHVETKRNPRGPAREARLLGDNDFPPGPESP